jgi:hypothetical protein
MLPTEDIIPISFMSGTGGNFLCHFIISAKINDNHNVSFSKYGNAHSGIRDLEMLPKGGLVDQDKILDYIFSQTIKPNSIKPYYTPAHLVDINLINATFKKSIRITYDFDDVPELYKVCYGKTTIDSSNPSNVVAYQPTKLIYYKYSTIFKKIENMSNVLFVSWKELFKGNIDDLTNKISTFTHINSDNFSKETLVNWRNITQNAINTFSKIEIYE